MTETLSAQPANQHGNVAHSHGAGVQVPDSSRDDRTRSFASGDFPEVTGREEEWRFAPLRKLAPLLEDRPHAGALSIEADLPAGIESSAISTAEAASLDLPAPEDRAAVMAAAHAGEVHHFEIAAEAELDRPAVIRISGDGLEPSATHLIVTAGPHSRGTVVIEHTGTAALTELVSVRVGSGAELRVISLQMWDDDAVYAAQHDGIVGRDSVYRHIAISLGGDVVRLNSNVRYDGPGGDAKLLGLYFADAGQHLEHRTYIDHNTPNAVSDVMYKGALQGQDAHTVWIGDVLIRPEALGITTYELNRNLVLTAGARADSVPNLEIETGDIEGAGHASSTGRFDEEHLFYLMSRGIPEVAARQLVVRGFFNEVIQQIQVPEVEEKLTEAIEDELRKTML